MARMTQREADAFRQKIKSLLAASHGWRSYEDQRHWLRKLVQREENYYTAAERNAVDRIAFARTPFQGWAGYSVPELAKGAKMYAADLGPDDEQLIEEAEHATQLVRDDMSALVGLCIFTGMDIPRFNPGPNPYRYEDDT